MTDRASGRPIQPGKQDVFGVPLRNVQRNVLDIASHYPINPERLRIFVDGSRVFPQYGSVAQYNHSGPHHELIPAQGETVTLETAERPRYAVGFEQLYSFALGLSRQLESGDLMRVGPYDDSDGWYLEHRGDHSPTECDIVVRSGGSDTVGEQDVSLKQAADEFSRIDLRTGWYRVTPQLWRESYANVSSLYTEVLGRSSVDPGPETGNLPLRMQIMRGASSSALKMEAGSMALITLGDKTEIRRVKVHEVPFTTDASADGSTWFPRYAMRIDPARKIVDTQISSMGVQDYGGTGDIRILLTAHNPSNVLKTGPTTLADSDFAVPAEHHEQNSVIEETDTSTVTQAADASGTTVTSTTEPGGYQIGYASLHASGQGSTTNKTADTQRKKRGLYGGDYAVMWVRAENSGVDAQVNITTEQDW